MMQELARRKEEALKEAQVKEVKHSLLSYNNNNKRNRRSMSNTFSLPPASIDQT